jgi:HEAT repeat protein
MKFFTSLIAFALIGVCFGAEHTPPLTSSEKTPTYDGKTLAQWIAQAGAEDAVLRSQAAEVLGKTNEKAITVLTELLKDRNDSVRLVAANAPVKLHPDDANGAIHCIHELLRRKDAHVRFDAALTLRAIVAGDGDTGSNPYAAHHRASVVDKLRSEVVYAATRLLEDSDGLIREAGASILAAMGADAKKAISALMKSLSDTDGIVRESAAKAIIEIDPSAKLPAVNHMMETKEKDRYVVLQNLHQADFGTEKAVPTIIKLLGSDDWFIRYAAASSIRYFGPKVKDAIPSLTGLLGDPDGQVRRVASEALERIGADANESISPLTKLLADKDSQVREAAAKALEIIRGKPRRAAG